MGIVIPEASTSNNKTTLGKDAIAALTGSDRDFIVNSGLMGFTWFNPLELKNQYLYVICPWDISG